MINVLWKKKTKSPSTRCTADWTSIWANNTRENYSKAWCGLGEKPAINQPQARKDGSHRPTPIHSSNTRTHRTRKKSIFRLSLCKNAILFIVFRILLAKVLTFAFFIYTFAPPNEKTQHYEIRFTTNISIYPLRRRSGSALLRNLYRPTRRDPLLSPCCLRRNSHLRRRTVRNRLRI